MIPNRTLALFLIILYIQFQGLEGRGELTIRLVSFDNDYGLTYDGGCCDNWQARGWGCMQKCDYVMRVVISGLSRANDHVFLFHRPLMYNKNNIIFDDCPWATELSIPFDSWPGQVELSAYFYDYDDNDDTTLLVDWFDTRLRQETISTTFQHIAVIGSRRNYKTRLTFDWAINCAELSNCVRKDVKQHLHRLDYQDIKYDGGISSAAAAASEEKPPKSMSTQNVESTTTGEQIQIMTNTSELPISSVRGWGRQKTKHDGTTGPPVDDDIDIRPTSSWITPPVTRTNYTDEQDEDKRFSSSITSTYSPFKTTVEHPSIKNWKPTRYHSSAKSATPQVQQLNTVKPRRVYSTVQPKSRASVSPSQRPTPRHRWTQPWSTVASSVKGNLGNGDPGPTNASTILESNTKEERVTVPTTSRTRLPYDENKNKHLIKNPTQPVRVLHPKGVDLNKSPYTTTKPQVLDPGQRPTASPGYPNRNQNRHKVRLKPQKHWRITKTGHGRPRVETAPEIPDYDDDDQMKEPGEWHGYHKIPGVIDPSLKQAIPKINNTVSRRIESNIQMTTGDRGHGRPRVETAPEIPEYDDEGKMKEPGKWHGYHKIPGVIDPSLKQAIPKINNTVSRRIESNNQMTTVNRGHGRPRVETAPELPDYEDEDQMKEPGKWHGYHKIPGAIDPSLKQATQKINDTVSRRVESNNQMTTGDGLKIISRSYYDKSLKGFQSVSTLIRIPSTRLNPVQPITAPSQDIEIHESGRQLVGKNKRPIKQDTIISQGTVRQNIAPVTTPQTHKSTQGKTTQLPSNVGTFTTDEMYPLQSGGRQNPFFKPNTKQPSKKSTMQETKPTQVRPTTRENYQPSNPFPTPVWIPSKNSNKPDNVEVDSSEISGGNRKYPISTSNPYYTEKANGGKTLTPKTTESYADASTSRNPFNSRPLGTHPLDHNKDFTDSFNTFNYFSDEEDEESDENFDQYFTDSSIPRFQTVKGVFSTNNRFNKKIKTNPTTEEPAIIEKGATGWFRKPTTRRYKLKEFVEGIFLSQTTNSWQRTTKTYTDATTVSPTSKSSSESIKPWYRAKDKERTYNEVKLIRKGNKTTTTDKINKAENITVSVPRKQDKNGETKLTDDIEQPLSPTVQPENVMSETTNWRLKFLNSKGTKNSFTFHRGSTRQRYTTRPPMLTSKLPKLQTIRNPMQSTTSKSGETIQTNQTKKVRTKSTTKQPPVSKPNLTERDHPTVQKNAPTKPKIKSPYYKKGTRKMINGASSTTKLLPSGQFVTSSPEKTTKGHIKTTSEFARKYSTTQRTVGQSQTEQKRFGNHKSTTRKAVTLTPTSQSTSPHNPFQKQRHTTRRMWKNPWNPRLLDLDRPFNSQSVTKSESSTKGPKWHFKTTGIPRDLRQKLKNTSITHPSVSIHSKNENAGEHNKKLEKTTQLPRSESTTRQLKQTSSSKIKTDSPYATIDTNKIDTDKEDMITATTTKYTSLDFQESDVVDAIGNWWKQFAPGIDTSVESSAESTTAAIPWTRNTWKRFRPKETTSSAEQTLTQTPKTTERTPAPTTENRHILTSSTISLTTKKYSKWRKPTTTSKLGPLGKKVSYKERSSSTQTSPTKSMVNNINNQPVPTHRTFTKLNKVTTVSAPKHKPTTKSSKTTRSFWQIKVNDVTNKLATRKPFYTAKRNRFRPTINYTTTRTTPKSTPARITTETNTIAANTVTNRLLTTGGRIMQTQSSRISSQHPATTTSADTTATIAQSWTQNTWVRVKSKDSSGVLSTISTQTPSSNATRIPSKLSTILKLSSTATVSQSTKTVTSSTTGLFDSSKSHSRNSQMPPTNDIRDDLKLIGSNEIFDDTKSTVEPSDIYDYFETSLFPSSKTTYRDFGKMPIEDDGEFRLIPVVASNTKPGYGTEFPYLNPDATTLVTPSLVSDRQKNSSPDKSNTGRADIEWDEEIQELVSASTVSSNPQQVPSQNTTSALNSEISQNSFGNNSTNSTKNETMNISTDLRNQTSNSVFVTPEIPNSTKLDTTSVSTKRATITGSVLLTTLIMPSTTVNVTSTIPDVTTTLESTSKPMSSTLSSTPVPTSTTILPTQTTVTSTIKGRQLSNVVPIKITSPPVSTPSTKRPVYSTRDPNSIKVTLPDIISLHNGTTISARNGGKPDFVLNTNPVKKKRPPVLINAAAAGGRPTAKPTGPPPTPKWREILPDLITLISVKVPVRTTPRAVSRKTISSSKPVSPASPVYQNADHNKRTKPLDFKTVVEKYWPAILGSFIGAVFLTAAILTSVLCKQQRIFLRRSRSRPQLRRSPASEQASSEQPEITESSSSASLCGDL